MQWKAALDADDNNARPPGARFSPVQDSKKAYANGTQSADIVREQEKLRWVDAVILQFPLWWFSMPAILKGWVECIYAYGLACGVGEHSDTHRGDRYGEGKLAGKRAMLVVTVGGWESHYAAALPDTCQALGQHLNDLWTTVPIRFRKQNAGDYQPHPALTLRPEIAPGQQVLGIHLAHD